MASEEVVKIVRVRGKISMKGYRWSVTKLGEKEDSTGENDIKLTVTKKGRSEWFIRFERVGGESYGFRDLAQLYNFKIGPGEDVQTVDDLINKVFLHNVKEGYYSKNKVMSLTSGDDFINPYEMFTGGELNREPGGPTIKAFLDFYIDKKGLTGNKEADTKFYEIVQDPFNESVVPPIPSGYFDIWNEWNDLYKKFSEDSKKFASEKPSPNSNPRTDSSAPNKTTDPNAYDPSKPYTFDVSTTNLLISKDFGTFSLVGEGVVEPDYTFIEEELGLDEDYAESEYQGAPEEDLDVVSGVSFTQTELRREENPPSKELSKEEQKNAGVNFGSSDVKSPSGNVSKTSIQLSGELKSVQNSGVLLKQSMGNGTRDIADIVAPSGEKITGESVVKCMNEFISDVLGPFSTWLKEKYPTLFKSWYITSACRGYIPSGGSLTSQHLKGQAIDSQILGANAANPDKNIELCNAILEWYKENPVGYGQILFETRGNSCWIHWSYVRGNSRLFFARFAEDVTKSAPANKNGKYVLPPLNRNSLGFA